jgi:hypothetical protein
MDKLGSDKPRLSVIKGDGEPDVDREGRIARARRQVWEVVTGKTGEPTDNPYGHLTPVPSPTPTAETVPATTTRPETVRSITEARSYQPPHETVEGTGALDPRPVPSTTEGELLSMASKAQRRMEQEARENVEIAHSMGPTQPNPEDLLQ